jgi:hypothetical protein
MGARGQAALAYLGQRYEERGGFITPRDFRVAAQRYSTSAEECSALERWLTSQMDWRTA